MSHMILGDPVPRAHPGKFRGSIAYDEVERTITARYGAGPWVCAKCMDEEIERLKRLIESQDCVTPAPTPPPEHADWVPEMWGWDSLSRDGAVIWKRSCGWFRAPSAIVRAA